MTDEQKKSLRQALKASVEKYDKEVVQPTAHAAETSAGAFMDQYVRRGKELMSQAHKAGREDFAYALAILHTDVRKLADIPSMMLMTEIAAAMVAFGYDLRSQELDKHE